MESGEGASLIAKDLSIAITPNIRCFVAKLHFLRFMRFFKRSNSPSFYGSSNICVTAQTLQQIEFFSFDKNRFAMSYWLSFELACYGQNILAINRTE